jgi:uncharacterized protein
METENIDKSQGWKNILKIIIPYCIVVGIFQLIGFYFAGLDIANYKNIQETTKQLFIIAFFSLVGTFVVVWLFRKYIDKKTFTSLGLKEFYLAKDITVGIAFGFIIMLLGFTCLFLTKQINILSIQFRPIEFILSIGLFIFVAVSEELFLRGYILNNLMTSFNKFIALLISSLIFSLLHALNPDFNLLSFIGLFIAGLFFGLAYIYTRSLWFPIALHFSWNFFQGTVFGFNVSGKDTYSLIVTKDNTQNIWNGGNFGFEGSIISIILQLVAIGIVFMIFKNRLTTDKFLDPVDKAAGNKSICKSRAGH